MSEYYEDDFEASGTGGPAGKGSNLSPMIIKAQPGTNNNILMPSTIGYNGAKVRMADSYIHVERWG
jgi:hypothetical protein